MAEAAATGPRLATEPFPVSVIIPVYESADKLERCLAALQGSPIDRPAEIIVVDDCSPRSSRDLERVSRQYDARYQRLRSNLGPGRARNEGAALAGGDILLFIDSDCVAPAGWVLAITRPIREGQASATTSCYAGPTRDGWLPDFQDEDFRYRMPTEECSVSFVNSCNLAVTRTIFATVGGFPEQRVSEDMVLGWRLAGSRSPARFLPEAGVLHDYERALIPYLKQRFRFALNTMASHRRHRNARPRGTRLGPHSFNPYRTAWCAAHGALAAVAIGSAVLTAAAGLPAARWLALAGTAALILEGLGHARFLLRLVRARGFARAASYLPLLFVVDLTHVVAAAVGSLRLIFTRTIPASPSP